MTAKADDQYEDELLDYGGVYPRTTQIIRLSEKADLVGALMDFDLSIVGCAYDGMDVRLTPRAAYSIVTLSQVVTPFTLEERRNLERISKYYKRGSNLMYWIQIAITRFCVRWIYHSQVMKLVGLPKKPPRATDQGGGQDGRAQQK